MVYWAAILFSFYLASLRFQMIGNPLRGEVVAGLIPVRIGGLIQLTALDALFPESGHEVEKADDFLALGIAAQQDHGEHRRHDGGR
jgi:hypothetical protein